MLPSPPHAFGKRNAPRPAVARAAPASIANTRPDPVDQTAFFEHVRAELEERHEKGSFSVPRSFKAAFLAGLVVGCALAGFNVTETGDASRFAILADHLGTHLDTTSLLPAMILLGLLGGARAGALTLLLLHRLLDRTGRTDRLSYALGGAAASACLAGVLSVGFGHQPAHGWAIECLSGAAAGLLYRVFAGTKPA